MSDEAAFLTAIKADPTDRSLWLVFADWLEDQGDARCEYLRADCELQRLLGAVSLDEKQVRVARSRLKKLAPGLDAAWIALLDALRPEILRCKGCKKLLTVKEAIDINPRNYTRMKSTRYCRLCYEDAIRSQLNHQSRAFDEHSRFRIEQISDE
jgi:uncharacterized protein (TIGR02996 family)